MTSPTPTKVETKKVNLHQKDFYDALRKVLIGKKLTRLAWNNKDWYMFMKDGLLMIMNEDGEHTLIVSDKDIRAKDWVLV